MHDKSVRRGMLVCWYGLRGQVKRVRMGRCLVGLPGETYGKWLPCSSVYVVPS
ncbi:hypothetical protein [Paracidovorax avenae]|uniref:hypothetical protein n=1 Tax=Paracidovorax avenae TaxID=80867 RepID=UPI001864F77D|nr:hypothetical protein [Paracidovorax avenae]